MVVIVTGASSNHFKSLKQFLDSAIQHKLSIDIVYAYDLGLEEVEMDELHNKYGSDVTIVKFDFSAHPDYFDIKKEAGHWAWKPAIIAEVSHRHSGEVVLWCDAGNKILMATNLIEQFIKKVGLYSPCSSGMIGKWTYPSVLDYFNFRSTELPCRNGAILGFNLADSDIVKMVEDYNHYAHIKEAIAPEGSSRQNHRQDQALFTILYYTLWSKKRFLIYNNYFGISIHNDID